MSSLYSLLPLYKWSQFLCLLHTRVILSLYTSVLGTDLAQSEYLQSQ
jgi:hypothetical protein